MEQVGLLEQELRGALPKLAQTDGRDDRVTLRVAVNADSLGTWFIGAMAQFVDGENALVDIALDNEEHTVEWLRSGEVLAAVTAHAQPVQGFNSLSLGRLTYLAVASPSFVRRYFPDGVNATARKLDAFRELQQVREQPRHQILLRLGGMTRDPERKRFVDVAIAVRELDVEVVNGRGECQRSSPWPVCRFAPW